MNSLFQFKSDSEIDLPSEDGSVDNGGVEILTKWIIGCQDGVGLFIVCDIFAPKVGFKPAEPESDLGKQYAGE